MENYKNPNENYFTSGATFDTSKAITTESLNKEKAVNTPPLPNLSTPENLGNFNLDEIMKSISTPSPSETKTNETFSYLKDLYRKTFNKAEDQQQLEKDAGIPEMNKLLTKAVNDFRTTTAEQNQLIQEQGAIPLLLQEESRGRGRTAGGLAPIQAGELRKNAIKQYQVTSRGLFEQAVISNLRDDITSAQSAVEKAIGYKYAPIEQEIAYYKDIVIPELKDSQIREDNKVAKLLETKLAERTRILSDAKEDSKSGSALALAAMKNYPNDQTAQYNAQLAMQEAQKEIPDINKIFQLVGKYQNDPIATEKAVEELKKVRAERIKLENEAKNAGVQPITNPEAVKYAGALSVILGSDKFTKEQKNALINSVNNGEDPVAVIKNQAKNVMGQTEANKVTNFEVAREQLDTLGENLKQFYANGGNTNIFRGNFEKVINKLGQVDDPRLVELAVQISASLQQYRNAVSGTAYSVQEGKDIASIFPGIDKSEGLNTAILAGRRKAFDATIDASYRTVLGQTYDVLRANSINANQTEQIQDAYEINGVKYINGGDGLYYPESQPVQSVQAEATSTPQKKTVSMLPNMSGYQGLSLNSIFKF